MNTRQIALSLVGVAALVASFSCHANCRFADPRQQKQCLDQERARQQQEAARNQQQRVAQEAAQRQQEVQRQQQIVLVAQTLHAAAGGHRGSVITIVDLDNRQQTITDLAFNVTTNITATSYGYLTFRIQVPAGWPASKRSQPMNPSCELMSDTR